MFVYTEETELGSTYSGASPGSSTSTLVCNRLGKRFGNVPLHEALGVIIATPIMSFLGERATSITSRNPLSNKRHCKMTH